MWVCRTRVMHRSLRATSGLHNVCLECIYVSSFPYYLWLISYYNQCAMTEIVWPTKPKIFTPWPLTENCWPMGSKMRLYSDHFLSFLVTVISWKIYVISHRVHCSSHKTEWSNICWCKAYREGELLPCSFWNLYKVENGVNIWFLTKGSIWWQISWVFTWHSM